MVILFYTSSLLLLVILDLGIADDDDDDGIADVVGSVSAIIVAVAQFVGWGGGGAVVGENSSVVDGELSISDNTVVSCCDIVVGVDAWWLQLLSAGVDGPADDVIGDSLSATIQPRSIPVKF